MRIFIPRSTIAFSAMLVVTACQDSRDPLSPELAAPAAALSVSATGLSASEGAAVGADLVDATEAFLVAIEDRQAQTDLRLAIAALADALTAENAFVTTAALETARLRLAAVSRVDLSSELAPVGLALDHVDRVLTGSQQ